VRKIFYTQSSYRGQTGDWEVGYGGGIYDGNNSVINAVKFSDALRQHIDWQIRTYGVRTT
jgi:hypothetical protein